MVETHEFKGLWWLPADEATKLSGTLKVKKGDAELELIGHFGHKLISKNGPGTEHVALTQEAALHLRFAKRAKLDEVFERVGQLRNFLSLAVGRPVTILSVTGYQDDYVREKSKTPLPIEVLWEVVHNPEPPTRPRHPIEMLFTLPEATPDISTVLKNWFAKQANLKPVFNLFFGMRYHPGMYLDVKFLAYAQAVETYDFRRRDPHELLPSEHRKRLRSILVAVPREWRDWLKMRLASSNYIMLDQRIRDVLGECPDVRAKIVGATDEELDAFVTTFKQSRNYYTHYNPKLEKKAATGAALYLLVVQLQAIIEMSLLRELGFTSDAVDAILERVQRYAEVAHFKALVAEEPTGNRGLTAGMGPLAGFARALLLR